MGKGILLELDGRQAVVLTPQGEFRRVPVPRGTWEVGDEIDFADVRPMPWVRWGLAAAAALALFILPVGYRSWALAQPVALVTIDINPSMELTLNQKEQVLAARGLNDDGVQLLEAVQWKRRPVQEVAAAITEEAVAEQKLDLADATSAVLVAVAPAEGRELPTAAAEAIAAETRAAITQAVTDEGNLQHIVPQTQVPVLQATAAEREAAREAGLTPGQYLLLEEIRQAVPEVDPEELRELGPGKLLKRLQLNPGEIFRKAEEHHGGKGRKTEDTEEPAVPAQAPADGTAAPESSGSDEGLTAPKGAGGTGQPGGEDEEDEGKPADKEKSNGNNGNGNKGNAESNGNGKSRGQPGNSGQSGNQEDEDQDRGQSGTKGNAGGQEEDGDDSSDDRDKAGGDDAAEPDDRGKPDWLPGSGNAGGNGGGQGNGNGNSNGTGNDNGNGGQGNGNGGQGNGSGGQGNGNGGQGSGKSSQGNGKASGSPGGGSDQGNGQKGNGKNRD